MNDGQLRPIRTDSEGWAACEESNGSPVIPAKQNSAGKSLQPFTPPRVVGVESSPDFPIRKIGWAASECPDMKTRLSLLIVTLTAVAATGCIHTEETVVRDSPRVPVEFETETAGRIFYEALSRSNGGRSHRESSSEVEVPFVFGHKTRTVRGPNLAFNEAVQRADTNHDGRITEVEARIYADQVR